MKKNLLQLFADDSAAESTDTQGEAEAKPSESEESKADEAKKSEAKYTDEDLDKIISAKFDKWQKQKDKEVSEAQKLAEMTAQEKAEYERDKLQKELDELRTEKARTALAKEARSILASENINIDDSLVTMLIGSDAQSTKEAISRFAGLFKSEVEKQVKALLKGDTPKTTSMATSITKDDIEKVADRAERQKLIAQNMNLYK